MKKISILLLFMAVLPTTVFADVFGIETSKTSYNRGKYHTSSCSFVKLMKPEYLIKFQTVQQAKSAGFVPCKVCKPN